ncbi:endonuclease/exonuclease/phosphatase family protein [Streptomyces prunicolor]|uniref:endonuclease/exonuclease/phosphatase family protein n=1 Tax=Streptomyces prunicolor TaxID=67348 RepID=UPI00225BE8A0|nr:endonuclease/exonuclease/phosphatase family protein [Streptomyces prunicolor]MCX5233924.1 endonuclease/exonuclease/phosphatase family protein [Streptomyces prunicolor]
MTPEVLVVASWNIQKNGSVPLDGRDHSPRPDEILAAYEPDIVFRQELSGAGAHGKRALYAEARALGGLIPFMGDEIEGRSKNPTGVMVDPGLFDIVAHTNDSLPWKQICHVQVRRKGSRRTLHLASAHLTHFDPDLRATEARRLTTYADHGNTVLIGMDANSYPHRTDDEISDPIDWDTVEDRVHFQHRTIERDGRRVSDTRPSEILTGGARPVYTDLAHHAATVLGHRQALTPTSSLHRTDQGPRRRIDWQLSTPDLASALIDFEVIDTGDVPRWTDHSLTISRFDLAAVDRVPSTAR